MERIIGRFVFFFGNPNKPNDVHDSIDDNGSYVDPEMPALEDDNDSVFLDHDSLPPLVYADGDDDNDAFSPWPNIANPNKPTTQPDQATDDIKFYHAYYVLYSDGIVLDQTVHSRP